MVIDILSREAAESAPKTGPWVSINDVGYEPVCNSYENLVLYFDDITPELIVSNKIADYYQKERESRELIMFNEEHALQCLCFIFKHMEATWMNIHCYYGLSRSMAVGHSFSIIANLLIKDNKEDYMKFVYHNLPKSCENPHVFRTIMGVYHDTFHKGM